MPDGNYCDVITGDIVNGQCTGRVVTVSGGNVPISIPAGAEDAMVAIHAEVILIK